MRNVFAFLDFFIYCALHAAIDKEDEDRGDKSDESNSQSRVGKSLKGGGAPEGVSDLLVLCTHGIASADAVTAVAVIAKILIITHIFIPPAVICLVGPPFYVI